MKGDLSMLHEELKSLSQADYEAKNYASLTVIELQNLIREKKADNLLAQLKDCEKNREWRKFQEFCFKLVKTTLEESEFENVETKYEDRTKYEALDASGQRRDILIVNNPRNSSDSSIWVRLKKEWDCKILIFDAKYYTTDLTDKEIYQMYAYLNKKTGRLGIILSKEGKYDRTAETAMRRIRDDNYGILIFSNKDITNWIKEYKESGLVQKTFFDKYTGFVAGFSP